MQDDEAWANNTSEMTSSSDLIAASLDLITAYFDLITASFDVIKVYFILIHLVKDSFDLITVSLDLKTACFAPYVNDLTNHFIIVSLGCCIANLVSFFDTLQFTQWRRPGAEFGGGGNFFRGPRLLNQVFFGKSFHFHGQNF